MPVINWDEGKPAGGDSLGIGDDEIRSTKSAIRTGLDAEHAWPSGGGDAGVHRLGSARPYVGAQSLVSSTGTDGRVMWASDTSNFFHVGSGGTAFIGGARVLSVGSYPGAVPQRSYWAMEVGSQTVTGSGALSVIFPNSGFSGQPFVTVSAMSQGIAAGATGITLTLNSVTAGGFNFVAAKGASATSNYTLTWFSVGTRAL